MVIFWRQGKATNIDNPLEMGYNEIIIKTEYNEKLFIIGGLE
jgi:hypothetical protein